MVILTSPLPVPASLLRSGQKTKIASISHGGFHALLDFFFFLPSIRSILDAQKPHVLLVLAQEECPPASSAKEKNKNLLKKQNTRRVTRPHGGT